MSPQLFHRQIADGAWAITLATAQQVAVAHRYGVRRVVLANQLVGPAATAGILDLLRPIPASTSTASPLGRERQRRWPRPAAPPASSGRSSCCSRAAMSAAAPACGRWPTGSPSPAPSAAGAPAGAGRRRRLRRHHRRQRCRRHRAEDRRLPRFPRRAREAALAENLFADGPLLLSAGGSAFYDMVVERFAAAGLGRPVEILIRSAAI